MVAVACRGRVPVRAEGPDRLGCGRGPGRHPAGGDVAGVEVRRAVASSLARSGMGRR